MTGLRVLVVEDEALIAMLVEDAVTSAGHVVAASAANITDAMDAAANADFDVALLDVNLNGQKAHALPVALAARGKQFAFLTGYGGEGVLGQFSEAPVLQKPFATGDIAQVLRALAEKCPG